MVFPLTGNAGWFCSGVIAMLCSRVFMNFWVMVFWLVFWWALIGADSRVQLGEHFLYIPVAFYSEV